MIVFWGIVLGIPVLTYGAVGLVSPARAKRFTDWFRSSNELARVLTCAAWFWTAWELDNIGICAFDAVTKIFPGELWFLAALLTYLTIIWMSKNLPVRALTAILMLFPASLFRVTRLLLPASGFGAVHIFVVFAYIAAIIGMYGMFYPWRLEKALDVIYRAPPAVGKAFFFVLSLTGLSLFIAGFIS